MSGFIGAGIGIGLSYTGQNTSPTLGGTFATFGEVTFTVVGSPTDLDVMDRTYYAKTDVIENPPVLQWIYDDLTTVRMSILLHYAWCTPQTVVDAMQQMRVAHQPQSLTVGSKNYGNFLIQLLETKDVWRADDGTMLVSKLRLELIQYLGQGQQSPTTVGTTNAPAGSAVSFAPMPLQQPPTANFQGVNLQDAVRMGGNAIVLAGNL